jgi:cysteine desulfurase
MGLSVEEARATLRLSLGWTSTDADVDVALGLLPPLAGRVREALR